MGRYIIRRLLQAIPLLILLSIGMLAAIRQGSITDYTLTTLAYFGICTPTFILGLLAQDIFGVQLHWLPTSGTATLGYNLAPIDAFVDHLEHLAMPVLVLAITFIAGWSRYMRSSMIEVTK